MTSSERPAPADGARDPAESAAAGRWRRYGITEPPKTPLRLGVLLDHAKTLPRWAAEAVAMLLGSGLCVLVLVVVPLSSTGSRPVREVLRHPAYYGARATIWRNRMAASARPDFLQDAKVLRVAVEPTHGRWTRIADPDTERIRAAGLDVALRFGFGLLEGEVLDAPRHGVWSFHHGDERRYRGRPAGFWELHDKSSEMGVVLQRLTNRLDAGVVLRRAILGVDPTSYSRTLDRVYRAGIDLPLQVCRDILAGRPLEVEHSPTEAPVRSLPSNGAVAAAVASTTVARVQRLAYGAFVLKQWSVGHIRGDPSDVLEGRLAGASWVDPGGRTRILADPMIVPHTQGRVVLCESLDHAVGRGVIARISLPPSGAASDEPPRPEVHDKPVLDVSGVHLSYPGMAATDEGIVLLPEASSTKGLLTAVLDDRADSIRRLGLAPGLAAIDPSLFAHEGRWWIATTEAGSTAASHLWLFHAPSPFGPWTAHARNPVLIDAGAARAAGLPFRHAGSLYRPAQDLTLGYGRSIRIMRILALTPADFAEEMVVEIRPDASGPFPRGLHTLSLDEGSIWIDGYRTVAHPLAWRYRLRARNWRLRAPLPRTDGWVS